MNRGDVVLVPFPFQDRLGEKIRPAVVVQNNRDNQRLANTILAMITGNLDDASQPTTVLVDPTTLEGKGSGLAGPPLSSATIWQQFVRSGLCMSWAICRIPTCGRSTRL
jgi:PemK-like, MazF-like toxin of type II toxin-antitoxin system